MKATEIIARDHRAAEALFDKFKKAPKEEQKSVEHDLFSALNRHESMEDKHFYSALRDKAGDNETLKQVMHEQTTLKLGAIATHLKETVVGPNEESVEKVMEKVLAHAKKEEALIFPLAEKVLGEHMLEEIGAKMEPDSAVANS